MIEMLPAGLEELVPVPLSVDFAAEGRFLIRDPWSLQIRAGTGRQRLSSSRNQRHSAASALLGVMF